MIDYAHIEHYETKNEIIQKLGIVNKHPYQPEILYEIEVEDLKKGDIISLTSAYEFTNNNRFEVMISSIVTISEDPKDPWGRTLDEGRGYNLTNVMHHGIAVHNRQIKLEVDYPGKSYIKTTVIAASQFARSNMVDSLFVEKGHGHLDAIIYKNTP